MRKALKVMEPSSAKPAEMELLISHDQPVRRHGSSLGARVKFHLLLFLVGLVGSGLCLWAMLDTTESKEKIENLGLIRVANSLENILALLAYPVLMFTIILSAYALQQLYRVYKEVNDPEAYRRNRH